MNLLMDAFEQANGFSSLTADELFFINGGSGLTIPTSPSRGGTGSSGGGSK
jgi:hypothetical protein